MRKYEIAVISKNGYARTVRIFSPKKADRAVIMHDGQNLFYDEEATYKKSWRVLDALKSLGLGNTAVIGIDSIPATRKTDYLPFPNELSEFGEPPYGGKADVYADYIQNAILPYLDKRFGYKMYGMLGSSAGGIVTLYYAARRDKRIRAYGIFSAPLFYCAKSFDAFLAEAEFDISAMYRIYTGGNERTDDTERTKPMPDLFVNDSFKLTSALRKSGATDIKLYVNNAGIHDETCWREPEREFFDSFSRL